MERMRYTALRVLLEVDVLNAVQGSTVREDSEVQARCEEVMKDF